MSPDESKSESTRSEREFVTGNEIPRVVGHRCKIEASMDVAGYMAT
jgi:hypothetical protein